MNSTATSRLPRIVSAEHDILIDSAGNRLIDLFSANGAALLGHSHPRIAAAIKSQLDSVWLTGGLSTPVYDQAEAALQSLLGQDLRVAGFYSTGMESAEFAMRMARVHTSRSDFAGFSNSMHGKSAATAALGWDNAPSLSHVHRLPSLADASEHDILERLAECLRKYSVAAVFIEPVLGTGGGYEASEEFCAQMIELCHAHGSLVVMDEILTGFYRTGPLFIHAQLPEPPDVILLGKALANGFPASAVVARREISCTPSMLQGSTFAGNPLAAAAIAATLHELAQIDIPPLVAAVSRTVDRSLGDVPGVKLRGKGALWMMELRSQAEAKRTAEALYARGIFISYTSNYLRLLPSITIDPANLVRACQIVRTLLLEGRDG
jgi:acetylornithine/succinyldiaminopimelate/putrescine aminotransferase